MRLSDSVSAPGIQLQHCWAEGQIWGQGSFQELLSLENMIQGLVLPPGFPRTTTIATNVNEVGGPGLSSHEASPHASHDRGLYY